MTRSVVRGGRRLSTRLMEDVGTVTRPADGGTLDPVTGVWSPTPPVTIYSGPCRVQLVSATEQEAVFGDTTVTTVRVVITFPFDVADFKVDDVVAVAGRVYRVVVMVPPSTFLMRRQVGCEVTE